jgi:hypothetical protein
MPKGRKYKGEQGQSGMTPSPVGSRTGAYGYSANTMAGAKTPNTQGWNGYDQGPERGGAIKSSHRGMKKSGGGMDY